MSDAKDSGMGTKGGGDAPLGSGGELHQQATGGCPLLTTNQGTAIADDQNSLRANPRGTVIFDKSV